MKRKCVRVNLSKIIIGVLNEFIILSKRKILLSFFDIVMFFDELFILGVGCGWFGDIIFCWLWWFVWLMICKLYCEYVVKGYESFFVVKWMILFRYWYIEFFIGIIYFWKMKSWFLVLFYWFLNVVWYCGLKKFYVNFVDVSLWVR